MFLSLIKNYNFKQNENMKVNVNVNNFYDEKQSTNFADIFVFNFTRIALIVVLYGF